MTSQQQHPQLSRKVWMILNASKGDIFARHSTQWDRAYLIVFALKKKIRSCRKICLRKIYCSYPLKLLLNVI
jgi:hypothetical protein